MSVVLRVPEELYESARKIAALQGRQAGDLLNEAWEQYLETHREQLATDFEDAAKMIRAGDTSGLGELANRTTKQRAADAASRARAKR
jgi:predicted DNA-binding protein